MIENKEAASKVYLMIDTLGVEIDLRHHAY